MIDQNKLKYKDILSSYLSTLGIERFEKNVFSLAKFAERSGMNPVEVVECFQKAFWKEITPGEYNRLLTLLIEKAVVWDNKLEIEFKTAGIRSLMEGFKND